MKVSILGKDFTIEVSEKRFVQDRVLLGSDKITVFVGELSSNTPKNIFEKWIREYARKVIETRTKDIAEKYGFKYKKISIRAQSTRWGSCSSDRNLNFNWKLIMAPVEVLDYVIVHELCHTVEMNHSKSFWNLVASVMPNYKVYRDWLKKNGGMLIIK